MNNITPKVPNRIRTFATDIEAVRGVQPTGQPTSTTTPQEVKKVEPTYAASPQPINHHQTTSTKVEEKPVTPKTTLTEKKGVGEEQSKPVLSKIPSFHEISQQHKNSTAISVTKEPRITVSKKQKDEARNKPNVGYDSTIITDTKSNRFKLFPSIVNSLRTWFKALAKRKKRSTPQYVIPETERRKGVIQRATSKSGTIFTADNDTLKEQIRLRQQEQETQLQEEDEPETMWSPYTEAGYELLEAPEEKQTDLIQNIKVIFKKNPAVPPAQIVERDQSIVAPKLYEPTTPQKLGSDTAAIDIDEMRWNAKPEISPVREEEIISEATPLVTTPLPTEEVVTPEPEEVKVVPVRIPVESKEADDVENITVRQPKKKSKLTNYKTNTLTIVLLSSVIGLVILVVGGRIAFQYMQTSMSQEDVQTQSTAPVTQAKNFAEMVLRASDTTRFSEVLLSTISSSSQEITEFSVVSPVQDEISPSYIFDLLNFRTAPTLKQSLTTARFIALGTESPAILLQFVDKDTVHGGFLAWEETMTADFRTLYNIPLGTNQKFIDDTINSIDVRVLILEEHSVLVYGFLGDRTILVTNTKEDFAQISTLGLR